MGRKIIYLVRHGHYESSSATSDPSEGCLTELGKTQAYLVAQRLCQFPIDRIHSSSMKRAVETADAIATVFPDIALHTSDLLWEFHWKIFTETVLALEGEELKRVEQTKQRIEIAFQKYFTPSLTETEQREILVCHGNIIRYFVCRALRISLECLSNMESANCGITTFAVETDRRLILIDYNDVGHLPIAKQTYLRYIPVHHP